ncbi:MAG TPA: phage Gp37/Gp68 family protein [Candidatus Ozemobacteraceae bacterium]|nr:phage Gp37/Gp68 family protein [Candidatus Ozemobacteraceae bacterium]
MALGSSIEWTETTWNPVTGCTKVSPGCRHCYAERMTARLQSMGQANYARGFEVATHEHMLTAPLRWKKPQTIFVNSMSDLFHVDVPESFIKKVFDVMNQAHWHTFQVLTKRSERMADLGSRLSWPGNVWAGVSVESAEYLYRIDHVRKVPAQVRFVSFEPLLAGLGEIDLRNIHWAIVGGESGPGARPIEESWVAEIRDQCLHAGVPFFFKQWGGVNKKKAGRLLHGRIWDSRPQPHTAASVAL